MFAVPSVTAAANADNGDSSSQHQSSNMTLHSIGNAEKRQRLQRREQQFELVLNFGVLRHRLGKDRFPEPTVLAAEIISASRSRLEMSPEL